MEIHKLYTVTSVVPKAERTSYKATLFHKENQPILKGVLFFLTSFGLSYKISSYKQQLLYISITNLNK